MMESECCCRICLRADIGQELISVFCKGKNETIANMLMDCGGVMVSEDDALPGRVCLRCLTRLEQAYDLRKLIQKSDSSFRKITKKFVKIKPFLPDNPSEDEIVPKNDNAIKSKPTSYPTPDKIKNIVVKDTYTIIQLKGFRCCGCKMIFNSTKLLDHHCAQTHRVGTPSKSKNINDFECPNCLEVFPNKLKLRNHSKIYQSNNIYHCTKCDITFDIEYRLQQHQSLSKAHRNQPNENVVKSSDESPPKAMAKIRSRPLGRRRVTKELKYPDQKNIIGIDETAEYQIIHVGGERCCGCEFIFPSVQELNDHCSQMHHRTKGKASFECSVCYEQFDQVQSFNRHKSARKHKQLYFCKLCDLVVDVRFRFEQHMKTSAAHKDALAKKGIEPSPLPEECLPSEIRTLDFCINKEEIQGFRCCGCNYTCNTEEELKEHSEAEHGGTRTPPDETAPHECTVCFKRFSKPEFITYHHNAALQSSVYKCKYCDMQSEIKYRVMQHIASGVHEDFVRAERKIFNLDEKSFICCFVKCTSVFEDSNELLNHVESVHASKRKENAEEREHEEFICYVCHKSFRSEKSLYFHQFPRKLDAQHICTNCGASFSNVAGLKMHEKTHIGQREFQCELCEKAFFDERALRVHKVCHNSERPYVCDICNKSFLRKGNLKVHKRCHAESNWDCPHCDEKFKTQQSLVLHVRYHTGEKPFQCRYCSNRYSHTTDRQRHEMAAHTKVRPHKCSKCPAAFIRKRQLTIHERIHTGDRPFECQVCTKRFIQKNNLRKHMTLHAKSTEGENKTPLSVEDENPETNLSIELIELSVDGEYMMEEQEEGHEEDRLDNETDPTENQSEG